MTWIQTYTGQRWELLAPKAENVRLDDIVMPLSRLRRFNGHLRSSVVLSEHSMLVAALVGWKAKPYALLHDGHETYIGDITTPVASAFDGGAGDFVLRLRSLKEAHDRAIFEAFGLSYWEDAIRKEISEADHIALEIERRRFSVERPDWKHTEVPRGYEVPETGASEFREALRRYCPKVPA